MKYKVGQKFIGRTEAIAEGFEFDILAYQGCGIYVISWRKLSKGGYQTYRPTEKEIDGYIENFKVANSPLGKALL